MIKNLQCIDEHDVTCEAQVCIIGAGTAGIFLTQQLSKRGIQVVLLEAGDTLARKPEEVDQHCEQRGVRYHGAESGRSFGLGGTSVLWGGQMLPLARSDMEARPAVGFDAWPIQYEEIASYIKIVQHDLGLRPDAGLDDTGAARLIERKFPALRQFGGDFQLRLSQWLPFKKRNFAKTFARALKGQQGVTVWLNAAVVEMTRRATAENRQFIEAVTAQSLNGRRLHVHAPFVVIAAGALESTRLLLEFDEATECSITSTGAPLGRYFSDHISVTCGRLFCRNWQRYNLAVAPIFDRGLMRSPRLELSSNTQRTQGLSSAFAHFTFITHGDTGFDVVRSILRRRQGEQHRSALTLALLGRVVKDVLSMVAWRVLAHRLWIPRQADLLLQVDIEQTANPESHLSLSDGRDVLGRKRLVIDWRITAEDVCVIRKVAELAINTWKESPLSEVAILQLTLPDTFDSFSTLHGVYHPTGSIRMGTSPANSVVNENLRLWAMDNCYVTTTAVFPSAGSANPGMTHLALTARLAEHIGERLRLTGSSIQ